MEQKVKQSLLIAGKLTQITAIVLLVFSILGGIFMFSAYLGYLSFAHGLLMVLQVSGAFMLAALFACLLFLLLAAVRCKREGLEIRWFLMAILGIFIYWVSPYDLIFPQALMLWASFKILKSR